MIAIDGEWYDLEKWALIHPGGAAILRNWNNCDATDAFYSLHSETAINKLKKMRPAEAKQSVPEPDKVEQSFRQFRSKLMNDGWWKREMGSEIMLLLPIWSLIIFGTVNAWTYPMLSILAIGVGMQQAGWLGHDMTHARDSVYCDWALAPVSGFINGFNRNWWSTKHNTHHVLTNHVGLDPDIDLMPFLFLSAPTPSAEMHLRKYQHIYAWPLYSLLYVAWRYSSLQRAVDDRDWKMLLFTLLPGYVWLACLPLAVSVGSVLFGGLLVALVVTQSHEMEPMRHDDTPSNFAITQFESTRDILCPDWITEYLFGGMQYQLTHHLFPTLPRYKYRRLQPIVMDWAKSQGIEYKASGVVQVFCDHYAMLKENATAACAKEGTYPEPGWSVKQAADPERRAANGRPMYAGTGR